MKLRHLVRAAYVFRWVDDGLSVGEYTLLQWCNGPRADHHRKHGRCPPECADAETWRSRMFDNQQLAIGLMLWRFRLLKYGRCTERTLKGARGWHYTTTRLGLDMMRDFEERRAESS